MTAILAIDPGTTVSGWAILDGNRVVDSGVSDNAGLLYVLSEMPADSLAIEVFEARGMPIGQDSIETILWTGRFIQAWESERNISITRVRRSEVKLHLCGTARAKDANIRKALIDRLGPPGTKKTPGPTYGVTSHAWAALAVSVTAQDAL